MKKIPIIIITIVSLLIITLGGLNLYNKYKIAKDPDYIEALRRIENFQDLINPPLDLPQEENGHYWYAKAFEAISKETIQKSRITELLENPEKLNFQNQEIADYLETCNKALEFVEKGNKCKYFNFSNLTNNDNDIFDKVLDAKHIDFMKTRHLAAAYYLKASCYINEQKYDKASEMLHEGFTLTRCILKNHNLQDRKVLIFSMVENAIINLAQKPMNHLLEKSEKPYPLLLSDINLLLNDIGAQEFKNSLDTEIIGGLLALEAFEKLQQDKTFTFYTEGKGYQQIKSYTNNKNEILNKLVKMYNSLYYPKIKASLLTNYKNLIKYIDEIEFAGIENINLEKINVENNPAKKISLYPLPMEYDFSNFHKAYYQTVKTRKLLSDFKKELESREKK